MITPYSSSDEESTPPDSPLESLVFQHDFSQLPERYYRRLITNGVVNGLVNVPETTESRESREKDLRAAFDWVKQQLAIMKEQDKSLLKQFISLRTTILQLRCLHEIYSSQSDISSIDGSTCSLNSPRVRHRYHRTPDRNHIHFMELSLKTKSLLFLPEPNTVKTLKWKSDEIL
ncbi:hypothetical protein SNE40_004426 [Patella caerulea]|uniref:Uncharacterized protein n=1 Tax=Patella caerulea TaxID=87958 RepID=A0AAN8K5M8_PATCE